MYIVYKSVEFYIPNRLHIACNSMYSMYVHVFVLSNLLYTLVTHSHLTIMKNSRGKLPS